MNKANTAQSTDAQAAKVETPATKESYRAPRLVPLGTAVGLVQGASGYIPDGGRYTHI